MKIHTASCYYAATGEGATLFAYIAWASDEQEMREKLKSDVHEFWAMTSEVQEGVVRNEVTRMLWPEEMLRRIEDFAQDCAMVVARNEVHFNMS
ncbi:hypothetical protein IM725_03670 [Ramlibacter aquaticus]|uniref:Uncharacterized protein n=1 Tax=Ramlibacter aquaticus TaxID=2780094 RepID=A0ABR9SBE9_9BURK|nr:hypothetical protein [Ramlibacter aquaticus]MBE7939671.1 hypothetical protein [Ramlibacter aquaticus]